MDTIEIPVWMKFAERLGAVLNSMNEDEFLTIIVKGTNRYVQFAHQGAHGLRCEAVGNAYLEGAERLDLSAVKKLVSLGWRVPSGSPKQSSPMDDPEGSPNFYLDVESSNELEPVMEMVMRTLREIFGAPSPIFLQYAAQDALGNCLELPQLKLMREPPVVVSDLESDMVMIRKTLRDHTGIDDLDYDEDGEISFSRNGIGVTVVPRLPDGEIGLRGYLADGEAGAFASLDFVNDLNTSIHGVRFFLANKYIAAVKQVPTSPLVPSHLTSAIERLLDTVEQINAVMRDASPLDVPIH